MGPGEARRETGAISIPLSVLVGGDFNGAVVYDAKSIGCVSMIGAGGIMHAFFRRLRDMAFLALVLSAQPAHAQYEDTVRLFIREGLRPATGDRRTTAELLSVADDNVSGETLSTEFVRRLVANFKAKPDDVDERRTLGLLALAFGAAQWGLKDPAALKDALGKPVPDPAGQAWKSISSPEAGKHVMSYAKGGVGIAHWDQPTLADFIEAVGVELVPADKRQAYLRLKHFKFDNIRSTGMCRGAVPSEKALDGLPFGHFQGLSVDCSLAKGGPTKDDWTVFRTWTRAALRTEKFQFWIFDRWIRDMWDESVEAVRPGEGRIEEALINARIRNSGSGWAGGAIAKSGASTAQRIQYELDHYGKVDPSAYERRCERMQRPVVLYRHFAGLPALPPAVCH